MLSTLGIGVEPVPTMIVTVPPPGRDEPTSGDWSTTTSLSMLALTPRTMAVRPAALIAVCAWSSVLPRSCGTAMERAVGLGAGVGGAGVGLGGLAVGDGGA